MRELLIAEQDGKLRKRMADFFIEAGYHVTVTDSAANALHDVLKHTAQVVILGSVIDDVRAADLIPLLKRCNPNLNVILVTGELSLPLLRRLRKEGIFYHASKPVRPEDGEEIRQAVECAFDNLHHQDMRRSCLGMDREIWSPKDKEAVMNGTRMWIATMIVLASALPAYAVDTSKTYQSGILVVAFLGVCALIVVAQLLPSLVMLFSWLKGLSRRNAEVEEPAKVKAH